MKSIYQFSADDYKGTEQSLSKYQGKTLLIVNTASRCGFTPQYEGLEKLKQKFQNQGFEVLAFPCNQFKQQESGSNDEIKAFCDLHFKISFPLFAKIDVNGDNEAPFYTFLKSQAPGILGTKSIKWNFTKFLVSKEGQVVKRYAPLTKPAALEADIKAIL